MELVLESRSEVGNILSKRCNFCRRAASWPVQVRRKLPVLGRHLNNAGSLEVPFAETVKKMCGRFWKNAGSGCAKYLPPSLQCILIDRAVRPLFELQFATWPGQKQYADKLDVLQRKMHAITLGTRRQPCDTVQQYNLRRFHIIGIHARQCCS